MFGYKLNVVKEDRETLLDKVEALRHKLNLMREQYTAIDNKYHSNPKNIKLSLQRDRLASWEYGVLCELNLLEHKLKMPKTMPMNGTYSVPSYANEGDISVPSGNGGDIA